MAAAGARRAGLAGRPDEGGLQLADPPAPQAGQPADGLDVLLVPEAQQGDGEGIRPSGGWQDPQGGDDQRVVAAEWRGVLRAAQSHRDPADLLGRDE
jgi:hypothetical protein